jgi:capsular exopolysaccharide synthesis family protein
LGRRTILVDFDMRKPKRYFNGNSETKEGLSSYMINKIDLASIITKSPHEELDYINAGILPPNPVELIALEKTDQLLTYLKNIYDIVILDTTPLAQVTDAYLLIPQAEIKMIVTRQNVSLKKVLSVIMNDLITKEVRNICVVLNDNREFYNQYGYGYGYYANKKKTRKFGIKLFDSIKT